MSDNLKNVTLGSIFGESTTTISKSIVTRKYGLLDKEFSAEILKQLKELAEFMGEECFKLNITPKNVELLFENSCYGQLIGYSLFVTGEKYDDVRGVMLSVVQESNRMARRIIELEKRNKELRESLEAINKALDRPYEE